ncbi:DNA mismatch repair endonuclease MutL [bacterium]|nr:DNA mismatch repair endonuclease MutL [bacterium]
MSVVRKLPEHVINQIKAGEVVERPSSVVKELLENAIDAQAQEIEIELLDGGRQLVRIVDNGSGMSPEDALLALERHATSKILSFEDLHQLSTFGFRGEALPSIAAVSDFTLRTRRSVDATGVEIHVRDGHASAPQACGMAVGSEVIVRDLFCNVPARRKFLRATATELGHTLELVQAMSLAYYRVGLRLTHNGRDVLNLPPAQSLEQRFKALLAGEASEYVAVNYQKGSFLLEGFVQKPEMARPVPRYFITFVNGRLVKDRIVRNGVLSGYTGLTMKGLVPGCVLFVSVDPALVDVNAHPNKTEIRFTDAPLVQDLVTIALQADLRRTTQSQMLSTLPTAETIVRMRPEMRRENWLDDKVTNHQNHTSVVQNYDRSPAPTGGMASAGVSRAAEQSSGQRRSFEPGLSSEKNFSAVAKHVERASGKSANYQQTIFARGQAGAASSNHPLAEATYLGQYKNCYLLFEAKEDLLVVDQHAFHERVLFEELALQIEGERGLARQSLLAPLMVPVPPAIGEVLNEEEATLRHLGFEIELLANRSVALHSLPTQVEFNKAAALFDDVVAKILAIKGFSSSDAHPLVQQARRVGQEWLDVGVRPANLTRKELFHLHLATVACHTAVRSGDPMNPELVRRLLLRGGEVDFFAHCPHGRPVWRRWTDSDVAQWFSRV